METMVEGAIFDCPAFWAEKLPSGIRNPECAAALAGKTWDILALTRRGSGLLGDTEVRCRILLWPGEDVPPVAAETVITCGLSPRDSLTLSSLSAPVLCVQRTLPRPDGLVIEPQEFPLPALSGSAEELLPLLGLRLLLMPLTEGRFP